MSHTPFENRNAQTAAGLSLPLDISNQRPPNIVPTTRSPNTTISTLCASHALYTKNYLVSPESIELESILKNALSNPSVPQITSTVCICLGSISGTPPSLPDNDHRNRNNPMSQLVAFERCIALLRTDCHLPTSITFQDPSFNSLDTEFLVSLGHTVLNFPVSDHPITPTTFLFAPHAPAPPLISSLHAAHPALLITTDLRAHRWWWWCFGSSETPRLVPCKAPRQRAVVKAFLNRRVGVEIVGEGCMGGHWVYFPKGEGEAGEDLELDLGDEIGWESEEEARRALEAGTDAGEGEGLGVCGLCDCDGGVGVEYGEPHPLDATVQPNFGAGVMRGRKVKRGLWERLVGWIP